MNYNFWFIVGSQDLYGEEVLKTVAQRAAEMAEKMSQSLPYPLIYQVNMHAPRWTNTTTKL